MKRLFIVTLVVILTFPSFAFGLGAMEEFSDVSYLYWASPEIKALTELGVVDGYPDGTFKPELGVTRAEFCKLLNTAMNLLGIQEGFKDFPDTKGHWARYDISTAFEYGIIQGFPDGKFYPDQLVSKAEALTMIAKANKLKEATGGHFADMNGHWAYGWVEACVAKNIVMTNDANITEGNRLYPDAPASRAKTVCFIFRMLENIGYVSPELQKAADDYYSAIGAVIDRWDSHFKLAAGTPRYQLIDVILRLQEDLDSFKQISPNLAFPAIGRIYLDYTLGMSFCIDGITAFMGEKAYSTSLGEDLIDRAHLRLLSFRAGKYWMPEVLRPSGSGQNPTQTPATTAPSPAPTSSSAKPPSLTLDVKISLQVDASGKAINDLQYLPPNILEFYVCISYANAKPNSKLEFKLFQQSSAISENSLVLSNASGFTYIHFQMETGKPLSSGSYNIEFWYEAKLVKVTYFTVEGI